METLDTKNEAAKRYDAGKIRWDLLPYDAVEELTQVYSMGAVKYGENNWLKGMSWSRCVASMMRHLVARMRGEIRDPESGRFHLAHVVWNALALLTYDMRGLGNDDMKEMYGNG